MGKMDGGQYEWVNKMVHSPHATTISFFHSKLDPRLFLPPLAQSRQPYPFCSGSHVAKPKPSSLLLAGLLLDVLWPGGVWIGVQAFLWPMVSSASRFRVKLGDSQEHGNQGSCF